MAGYVFVRGSVGGGGVWTVLEKAPVVHCPHCVARVRHGDVWCPDLLFDALRHLGAPGDADANRCVNARAVQLCAGEGGFGG